jgi:hypothetical protein
MNQIPKQQRNKDLQTNIHETLDLIKEYENKRRLSDDPKEQKNCERQIADLRRLLREYQAELDELTKATDEKSLSWPPNIPDERYYPLPGRETHLDQLMEVLQDPQGLPIVVIEGLGGLGKTAMAVELARRALKQELFAHIVGDSAKQELFAGGEIVQLREATLDFDHLLDAIARQLGRWEMATLKPEEKRIRISHLLREKPHLLLVDNLETVENANSLVAQLRSLLDGSRAIVTSRKKVQCDFARSIALEALEVEDTLFFLRTDAQQRGVQQILEASEEDLVEIHRTTGGTPLALKLVVAQAGFLELDRILEQLGQAHGQIYPFVFRQSWEQLSPTAQRVLIYIGKTVVTTVSWEELEMVGIAESHQELMEAINQLVAYSLVDVTFTSGRIRYGIHQLTRHFVTSELPKMWQRTENVPRETE